MRIPRQFSEWFDREPDSLDKVSSEVDEIDVRIKQLKRRRVYLLERAAQLRRFEDGKVGPERIRDLWTAQS